MESSGGLFERAGLSPSTRTALFALVCVPLRLGFARFIWMGPDSEVRRWALFLGALGASLYLGGLLESERARAVWWSRRTHYLLAVAVTGVALLLPLRVSAALLAADVALGVATKLRTVLVTAVR
jgi:hypothetical protein